MYSELDMDSIERYQIQLTSALYLILKVFVFFIFYKFFFKLGGIPRDKVMNREEINGEVIDNDDEEET